MPQKLTQAIKKAGEALGDACYPMWTRCVGCDAELGDAPTDFLCPTCLEQMQFRVAGTYCPKCGRQMACDPCEHCQEGQYRFDLTFAPVTYRGVARELILRYKRGESWLAHYFSQMMVDYYRLLDGPKCDAVTFVPTSRRGRAEKGYDHAGLLAKMVAKELGLPLVKSMRRVRFASQKSIHNYEDRRRNVAGAFRSLGVDFAGTRLLLVDDVMSTGATLDECARILKECGAAGVVALVYAL